MNDTQFTHLWNIVYHKNFVELEDQKKLIMEIFNNAVDVLSDEDRKLPQVENVLPLLKRGIGMHHSGLLPILKETIEILFGEGLLKVVTLTAAFVVTKSFEPANSGSVRH